MECGPDAGLVLNTYKRMLVEQTKEGQITELAHVTEQEAQKAAASGNKVWIAKTREAIGKIVDFLKGLKGDAAKESERQLEAILKRLDEIDNSVTRSPGEIAEMEMEGREEAEHQASEELGKRTELMDALMASGGLPVVTNEPTLTGELRNVAQAAKGAGRNYFRKNQTLSLDKVREAVNQHGFNFETPHEMLDAIGERLASGKPLYNPETPRVAGYELGARQVSVSDEILRKNDNWAKAAWLRGQIKTPLGEVPHEKLVENMAEWRHNYPDAKAAATAYPIPEAYLGGQPLRESEVNSENSGRSLAAYDERTGIGKSPASSIDGFKAAAEPLVREAERTGREFSPKLLDLVGARGGEHSVVFFPGRVLKFTEPDTAGGVVKFSSDGEPSVSHGTLPEYLKQIENNRDLGGDGSRVEGVMHGEDGSIRIVTSQETQNGVKPTYAEASNAFMDAGFMPVDQEWVRGQEGPELWWNKQENIGIADAKPDNLVKTDQGEIVLIDVKAFRPTGKALEWMKENGDSLALAKYRSTKENRAPNEGVQESPVDYAAHDAATSPVNELPEPTQAQKEAGNYQMGHVRIGGLDISVENPAGSTRSGTDKSGKPWETEMQNRHGKLGEDVAFGLGAVSRVFLSGNLVSDKAVDFSGQALAGLQSRGNSQFFRPLNSFGEICGFKGTTSAYPLNLVGQPINSTLPLINASCRIRVFHRDFSPSDFSLVTFRSIMQTLIIEIKTAFYRASKKTWCAMGGSNPRPLPCQGSALPLS